MRGLIFASLLVSCFIGMNYNTISSQKSHSAIKSTDTIFLLREFGKDYYHTIYIEKNRHSSAYQQLLDFTMHDWDVKDYKENTREMKKHLSEPIKKFPLSGLQPEWVPLERYKNKYYIYYPSEWGFIDRRIITDSTMVFWGMEGPDPELIQSAKQISANTWFLNLRSTTTAIGESKITIRIIDNKNKIAVWEGASQGKPSSYNLYVPREYAKNFDMIVNHCDQIKTGEFDTFDNVDYKTLLKGH